MNPALPRLIIASLIAFGCSSGSGDGTRIGGSLKKDGGASGHGADRDSGSFANSDAQIDPTCTTCDAGHMQKFRDGGVTDGKRPHVTCDKALALASQVANDGARAIGLCPDAKADDSGSGLVSAAYTNAVGQGMLDSPLQIGLVDKFGTVLPREGDSMLVLSSGVARARDQAGFTDSGTDWFGAQDSPPPPGFPWEAPRCDAVHADPPPTRIYNPAALSLELHVPSDAIAFSVDFNFFTAEYPIGVCTSTNDFFVILMDPAPAGAPHGNIAFDSTGNPISVGTGLLRACTTTVKTPVPLHYDCDLGTDSLVGTGFDVVDGGALDEFGASTGWLATIVAVTPGSTIHLRLAIWDTEDSGWDSTVLIDNFHWIGARTQVAVPDGPSTKPVVPD